LQLAPTTRPDTSTDLQAQVLPGLVSAFRFDADGAAEELRADRPIADAPGWLWLHFNLADARACAYLQSTAGLAAAARELLLAPEAHQQLHADATCLYGVFADLICGLGAAATDEIGFLHFAIAGNVFISGRRRSLNSLDAARRSLRSGRKIASPAALLETIIEHMLESVEMFADSLAEDLDKVEDRMLVAEAGEQHQALARVRKIAVRLHRQLATQRSLIFRFEREIERSSGEVARFATTTSAQRLDWLDHEMIALRDRAHLLQEEVSLKMAAQTNRTLQLLAIVTTLFLPANLIAAIFGMNVGGLPFTGATSGFAWAMVLLIGVSALVFWLLKRAGILGRITRR
jgi:zinc transporter